MESIYFPMSGRILTVGHIKCLEYLNKKGFVYIGLLTAKALRGYKQEVVPFKDRQYVLETVAMALGNIDVVPQDSRDPSKNIKYYDCQAIASGDGFNKWELSAIKKYKLKVINIKLSGEREKLYSSSRILKCQKKI